uniref:Uncharacterized protein n=1 Tax=Anopheles melas TaxID=34690 RepID=A0A182TDJ0_9DIPT
MAFRLVAASLKGSGRTTRPRDVLPVRMVMVVVVLGVQFVRVVIVRAADGVPAPDRAAPDVAPLASAAAAAAAARCRWRCGRRQYDLGATTTRLLLAAAAAVIAGGRRAARVHRAGVVDLPPPVNVFVRLFVLGEGEPGPEAADGGASVVIVTARAVVVVKVIANVLLLLLLLLLMLAAVGQRGLGRVGRRRETVVRAAAVGRLRRLVVERERPVQVELALEIVRLPLELRQDAVHLFQLLRVDAVAAVSFSRGLLVVEVSVSSELSDALRCPALPTTAGTGCCCPSSSCSWPSTPAPPPAPASSVASASLTSVRQLLVVLELIVPPLSIDFCEWAVSAFFSCCCLVGVAVSGTIAPPSS